MGKTKPTNISAGRLCFTHINIVIVAYSPLTQKQHLSKILLIERKESTALIQKKVGERVRELRISVGLSQEKLALKADIDRTYLASVEAGKRNISIVNLEKLVIALDVSLAEFFKEM